MAPFVLPLATTTRDLAVLGGKGRSLAALSRAGFAVPEGFHITTGAYARFVATNDLPSRLARAAVPEIVNGTLSFDTAATRITGIFAAATLPTEVGEAIAAAYERFANAAVAVRSSATAEDLPELSFAGQQDTYLNVHGRDDLLAAVRNCWASLYSARAMAYRHNMAIEQDSVAMAVVVQRLVNADVSGILFTANPATGQRDELVVNSSYGLGPPVVAGQVDPDTYVVDRQALAATSTTIGAKARRLIAAGNGTRADSVAAERRNESSLTEDQLGRLASTALAVERLFDDVPQDIEWSYVGDELWLLQSRPITGLPPSPLTDIHWNPPEPGAYLSRSQLVEHIPDPVSTLFEDLHMKRSLQHYWGMNLVGRGHHRFEDTQPPACFHVQTTINGFAYRHLGEPPRSARHDRAESVPSRTVKRSTWVRVRQRWMRAKHKALASFRWRYGALPVYLGTIRRWRRLAPAVATNAQLWAGIRAMSMAEARYWYRHGVWSAFSMSRGTEYELANYLNEHAPGRFTSGQFLTGLDSPAFDAQLMLWRIACDIRRDPALHALVVATPPRRLAEVFGSAPEAGPVRQAVERYIDCHGHQIFTLDFAEPCEAEQPEELMHTLHGLVLDEHYDPVARQRRLAESRRAAVLAASAHFTQRQRSRFRKLLRRARRHYPNRERAMFHMGKAWAVLRPQARELGRRLVKAGTLADAEDIYFLTTDEVARALRALKIGEGIPGYRRLAIDRRALRESRKRLAPPVEVPGPPPWAQSAAVAESDPGSSILKGSAVSPGKVTAEASLVLSAMDFAKMRPGTILVCPTTTPAWTQLFPKAVGLVTDIGGILAHGSIVAREYGIPAVLGMGDATTRIVDGQLITVDGNRGTVELL
ncbi:MAG: hypothetical protein F4X98_06500 [Gammaproteobacteria bacterium]|nr:hypothetical protein [Gammaproteobacteria bacterium]